MRRKLISALGVVALVATACGNGDTGADTDAEANGSADTATDDGGDAEADAAADWPTEDLTLVVTFGPGGGNDLLNRALAPKLSEALGVQVAIENVEGGGGVIGLTEAYQRGPDGTTLVSYSPPGEYLSEVQGQLSGFSTDDFIMLGGVNVDPGAFAVSMDSPYETFEELVAAMETETLAAATNGYTSNTAVGAMDFMAKTDLEFELIPYDAGSELTAAVIGGTADFGVRAGGWYDLHEEELRILAFFSEERLEEFPDIPTVEEVTGAPSYFSGLRGLAVHAETPPEQIAILEDAFEQASNDPDIQENLLADTGFRWEYVTREQAEAMVADMTASVDEFAEALGIS